MDEDNKYIKEQKAVLLKTIGKVVHKIRKEKGIGINNFSFAYDIGNGLLSRLENGKSDITTTTLWKIANGLGMKYSELIDLVEKELPKDFDFYK